MLELKKGKCNNCLEEDRILSKNGFCIFCTTKSLKKEIKVSKFGGRDGTEVKCNSSNYKEENAWMAKKY